jgi:hypothetical protein
MEASAVAGRRPSRNQLQLVAVEGLSQVNTPEIRVARYGPSERCGYRRFDALPDLASRSDDLTVAVRLQATGRGLAARDASRQRRLSARRRGGIARGCGQAAVATRRNRSPTFTPGADATRLPSPTATRSSAHRPGKESVMRSTPHSFPNDPCDCEAMLYSPLPMNHANGLPQPPARPRRSPGLAQAATARLDPTPTHRTP